ncbi:MAG TPA: hypothetical protein VMD48_12690 [Solirubrobacteraceae bacterium]|nr:hypothetical protein [Solirubrobacteraceae bacterium]
MTDVRRRELLAGGAGLAAGSRSALQRDPNGSAVNCNAVYRTLL